MASSDVVGIVWESQDDSKVQGVRAKLAQRGIASIVVFRLTRTGAYFGIAVGLENQERAKRYIESELEEEQYASW